MNYKQILACVFMSITTNSIAVVPTKATKKALDIVGLTVLLQRRGYEIISSQREKFEAQKKNIHIKSIGDKNYAFLRKKEEIESIDYCKITQLEDEDDFFVEVANVKSIKESLECGGFFQDEEDQLIEESCSSNKKTALVCGFERAIQVAASFLRKK